MAITQIEFSFFQYFMFNWCINDSIITEQYVLVVDLWYSLFTPLYYRIGFYSPWRTIICIFNPRHVTCEHKLFIVITCNYAKKLSYLLIQLLWISITQSTHRIICCVWEMKGSILLRRQVEDDAAATMRLHNYNLTMTQLYEHC